MNKKKIVTVLIVIATVILAGVAVFTAIRLYQLRQQAVAPTAPAEPEAAAPTIEECTQLAFTIGEEPTPTPTEGPTPTPTPTPTGTVTPTPTGTVTPTPTSTPGPTAPPTSAPTETPIAQATLTPTEAAELPEAGISYPTIIGTGVGILLLIASLLLAL